MRKYFMVAVLILALATAAWAASKTVSTERIEKVINAKTMLAQFGIGAEATLTQISGTVRVQYSTPATSEITLNLSVKKGTNGGLLLVCDKESAVIVK